MSSAEQSDHGGANDDPQGYPFLAESTERTGRSQPGAPSDQAVGGQLTGLSAETQQTAPSSYQMAGSQTESTKEAAGAAPSSPRGGSSPKGNRGLMSGNSGDVLQRRVNSAKLTSNHAALVMSRLKKTHQAHWLAEVVLQHWLPLLGAFTVVQSLIAQQAPLSMLEFLIGVAMVHLRMVQEWIVFRDDAAGTGRVSSKREQLLACLALVVGVIKCIMQAKAFFIDFVYFAVCLLGVSWARWGREGRRLPPPRGLHLLPIIVLAGLIATCAPPPGLASLPYAIIFLGLMLWATTTKRRHVSGIFLRVMFLLLTTTHILALSALHWWALVTEERPKHFQEFVLHFGRVGWSLSWPWPEDVCMSAHNGATCCPTRWQDRDLLNCHLGALLALHFWLCNVTTAREKEDDEEPLSPSLGSDTGSLEGVLEGVLEATEASSSRGQESSGFVRFFSKKPAKEDEMKNVGLDGLDIDAVPRSKSTADLQHHGGPVEDWVMKLASAEPILVLLAFVINTPTLLSMPMLLAASLSNPFQAAYRTLKMVCSSGQSQDGSASREFSERLSVARSPYIYWYSAFVFFVRYGTSIVSGGLPSYLRPHADALTASTEPVAENWRPWAEALGIADSGCEGSVWVFDVILPQAILVTCLAINQAGGSLAILMANVVKWLTWSDPREWPVSRLVAVFLHVPTEVSMLALFLLSSLLVMKEQHLVSLFALFYFSVLTILLIKEVVCAAIVSLFRGDWRRELTSPTGRFSFRWWLWFAVEQVAQIIPIAILLVYNFVGGSPDAWRPGEWVDWFFPARVQTRTQDVQTIVAVHFGISMWALFERWRISRFVVTDEGQQSNHLRQLIPKKNWGWLWSFFRVMDQSARALLLFLSVIVVLLPPVDVHSLAVLLVFSPSLLTYQLDRGKLRNILLDVVLIALLAFTTACLFQRVLLACPMVPAPKEPDETTDLTLLELGFSRPLRNPSWKMVFLGVNAILAHFTLKAATMLKKLTETTHESSIQELHKMANSEGSIHMPSKALSTGPENSSSMRKIPKSHRTLTPTSRSLTPSRLIKNSIQSMETMSKVVKETATTATAMVPALPITGSMVGWSMDRASTPLRDSSQRFFEDAVRAVPYRAASMSYMRAAHVDGTHLRTFGNRSQRLRLVLEEKLVRNFPEFLPRERHFYASVLLLFVTFSLAVNEGGKDFSVYNFVVVMSVLFLTAWRSSWVKMGVVLSLLESVCMIARYMSGFRKWESELASVETSRRFGLFFSASTQARHCIILLLCILQRQTWHIDQRTNWLGKFRRQGVCPDWLRKHADIVGIASLLLVAAMQQHFWGFLLAVAVMPWILNSGKRTLKKKKFTVVPDACTRCWSRLANQMFFRYILLSILIVQLSYRLLASYFDNGTAEEWVFAWLGICKLMRQMWESEDACNAAWQRWATASESSVIYEFAMLMFLGVVHLLLENDRDATTRAAQTGSESPRSKKSSQSSLGNVGRGLLLWWPSLTWFFTLLVSLSGGSLLGISHLVMLFGLSGVESKGEALQTTRDDRESRKQQLKKDIDNRKRWVWRTRLCAWCFFVAGLVVQSPASPCSRASCASMTTVQGETAAAATAKGAKGVAVVSQTTVTVIENGHSWMANEECVLLESLNITQVAHPSWPTAGRCQDGTAIGKGNFWTAAVELLGFWRVDSSQVWSRILLLTWSQHGWLLMLIIVSTIQLRIYDSKTYANQLHSAFVVETDELLEQRAQRQVLEFHLRNKLEARSAWHRQSAMKKKLQRTMMGIKEMLLRLYDNQHDGGRILRSPGVRCPACVLQHGRKNNHDETKTQQEKRLRTAEAVQVSHGISESFAKDVTRMFNNNVIATKKYLNMLERVAVGRLQPSDGEGLQSIDDKKISGWLQELRQACQDGHHGDEEDHMDGGDPAGDEKDGQAADKQGMFSMSGISGAVGGAWERFKVSPWLADRMLRTDYAFLGVDESKQVLRSSTSIPTEEMDRHRASNGPMRLLWKLLLGNTQVLVALAHVLAFIQTPSVLEMLRMLVLFFGALRKYPFPPHNVWPGLFGYGAALLVFRTLYNFTFFCPFPQIGREYHWDDVNIYSFDWCPMQPLIGLDGIIGVVKHKGESAGQIVPWFWAVYADHFCIWSLALHIWMLKRAGLLDFVVFDADSQRMLLLERAESPYRRRSSGSSDGENSSVDIEDIMDASQSVEALASTAGEEDGGGDDGGWWSGDANVQMVKDSQQHGAWKRTHRNGLGPPTIPEDIQGRWVDEQMLKKGAVEKLYDGEGEKGPGFLYDGSYITFTMHDWGPMCPTLRRQREAKYSWEADPERPGVLLLWEKHGTGSSATINHFICRQGENTDAMTLELTGTKHVWNLRKVRGNLLSLMEQIHGVWEDVDGELWDGGHVIFNHAGWYPCVHKNPVGKRSRFEMHDVHEDKCLLVEIKQPNVNNNTWHIGDPGFQRRTSGGRRFSTSHLEEYKQDQIKFFLLSLKHSGIIRLDRAMLQSTGEVVAAEGDLQHTYELQCVLEPMRGRPPRARRRSPTQIGQLQCSMGEALLQQKFLTRATTDVPSLLFKEYHAVMVRQYVDIRNFFMEDFKDANREALERRQRRHPDLMLRTAQIVRNRSTSTPSLKSHRSSTTMYLPSVEASSMKNTMKDLVGKAFRKKEIAADVDDKDVPVLTCLGGAELREHNVEPVKSKVHFAKACACCGQEIVNNNTDSNIPVRCYSCPECDYRVCDHCVRTGAALRQQSAAETKLIKPGISVYWLQFVLALLMFIIVLLFNAQILGNSDQNFVESLLANNFSSSTILMVFMHLMILVLDRVLYNIGYRAMSDRTTTWLRIVSRYGGMAIALALFVWIHVLCIRQAYEGLAYRSQLTLHYELYLYYVCCMCYLGACVAKEKYGQPAVEADEYKLRPVDPVESQGVFPEKFRYFYFVGQTSLPFVDDLRIVIDWSVMPTSLDLWMHWKVEDAYNMFFKTRHQMFVRRQSHWAETRDPYEKCYNGWIIVVGIIALLLFPIMYFNPEFSSTFLKEASCDEIHTLHVTCRLHLSGNCGGPECARSLTVYSQHADVSNPTVGSTGSTGTSWKTQKATWPEDSSNPFAAPTASALFHEAAWNPDQPFLAAIELDFELSRLSSDGHRAERSRCLCQPFGTPACDAVTAGGTFDRNIAEKCTVVEDFAPYAQQLAAQSTNATGVQGGNGGGGPTPFLTNLTLNGMWMSEAELTGTGEATEWTTSTQATVLLEFYELGSQSYWTRVVRAGVAGDPSTRQMVETTFSVEDGTIQTDVAQQSGYGSAISLYIGVVFIAGKYLRSIFALSSTRAFWEEIPDVDGFLDLVSSVKIARDHGDLRTEFQLYYCLMKVLRSPILMTAIGGQDLEGYSFGRSDPPPRGLEPTKSA